MTEPLSPEEEARWRSYGGDVGKRAIDRVWATLDAARTPDVDAYLDSIPVMTAQELRRRWPASVERLLREAAPGGLREAARTALRAYDAEAVAVLRDDQDEAEEAALDTVDAMETLRAALAAPAPDGWRLCPTGYVPEDHAVRLCKCAAPAPDDAAPDLRSSAGWLVERWDGNRTVQPDALRADIAVLRDALRNPKALSTLESSQPTALRLLAEHAVECPDLDYDDEAAVVAAARAVLAAPAPDAEDGGAG